VGWKHRAHRSNWLGLFPDGEIQRSSNSRVFGRGRVLARGWYFLRHPGRARTTRAMAGVGRGDGRDCCDSPHQLSNGAEALITAGLIHHYFGAGFNLVRVRHVAGLLAAAVAATTVSGIGGAVTYWFMRGPSAPILDSWLHWFASDFVGIIAVAPLVFGLAAVVRRPSPWSEEME
jgi:MASE1